MAKAWATANPSSELARTLMYYISKISKVSDEQAFIKTFIRAVSDSREDVITLAPRFEQRDLQQSKQFARKDERHAIAKKILAKGADTSNIEELIVLSY